MKFEREVWFVRMPPFVGHVPVARQGWLILGAYVAFLAIVIVLFINFPSPWVRFPMAVVGLMGGIAYSKIVLDHSPTGQENVNRQTGQSSARSESKGRNDD